VVVFAVANTRERLGWINRATQRDCGELQQAVRHARRYAPTSHHVGVPRRKIAVITRRNAINAESGACD
jgi:hypothetical protein